MRIYVEGQGERERTLKKLLAENGHQLPDHGPWDTVVLPLPRSFCPASLGNLLPEGQKIVCGMTDEDFEQTAREKQWILRRVLRDEAYAGKNAVLSAEGAVCFAMEQTDISLWNASCLVIGYGRIGKALTEMLRALHAHVTVAARRKESRDAAGSGSIPMEAIPAVLPGMDVIFNTVPAPVLGEKELRRAKKGVLMLELASPPYGIDLQAAKSLHLNARLESGIPGRYCPRSAAQILMEYIEREE